MPTIPSHRFLKLDKKGLLEYEDNTCMWCGEECKTTELIWTGDEESFEGWEVWCYCNKCKTDTFHRIKLKE